MTRYFNNVTVRRSQASLATMFLNMTEARLTLSQRYFRYVDSSVIGKGSNEARLNLSQRYFRYIDSSVICKGSNDERKQQIVVVSKEESCGVKNLTKNDKSCPIKLFDLPTDLVSTWVTTKISTCDTTKDKETNRKEDRHFWDVQFGARPKEIRKTTMKDVKTDAQRAKKGEEEIPNGQTKRRQEIETTDRFSNILTSDIAICITNENRHLLSLIHEYVEDFERLVGERRPHDTRDWNSCCNDDEITCVSDNFSARKTRPDWEMEESLHYLHKDEEAIRVLKEAKRIRKEVEVENELAIETKNKWQKYEFVKRSLSEAPRKSFIEDIRDKKIKNDDAPVTANEKHVELNESLTLSPTTQPRYSVDTDKLSQNEDFLLERKETLGDPVVLASLTHVSKSRKCFRRFGETVRAFVTRCSRVFGCCIKQTDE